MKSIQRKISTRNGRIIGISETIPLFKRQMTLVLCKEIGYPISFYTPMLQFLTQHGIRVITFDDRNTVRQHQDQSPLYEWATQGLDAIILFAHQQYPQDELLLLAHGGSAQFVGLSPAISFIHKMVFFNGNMTQRSLESWFNIVKYGLKKWQYSFLNLFSKENKRPVIKKRIISSLFKWSLKTNGLFDLFPDSNFRKIKIPILALYTNTKNLGTSKRLLSFFPSANLHFQKSNQLVYQSFFPGIENNKICPEQGFQQMLNFLLN